MSARAIAAAGVRRVLLSIEASFVLVSTGFVGSFQSSLILTRGCLWSRRGWLFCETPGSGSIFRFAWVLRICCVRCAARPMIRSSGFYAFRVPLFAPFGGRLLLCDFRSVKPAGRRFHRGCHGAGVGLL